MKNARITDARMPPFCWQEKAALRLIRGSFKDSEIATALAIYVALTYYASNNQSDEFHMKRQTLCDFVGRSPAAVDRYTARLAEIGVVEKAPLTKDHEYRCMTFRLLPTPPAERTHAYGAPPPTEGVSSPTRTPPPTHDDTPTHPRGQVSSPTSKRLEESVPQKNPPPEESRPLEIAGPEAPLDSHGASSTEMKPPLEAAEGGAAAAGAVQAACTRGGFTKSERGGSGVIKPWESEDEDGDRPCRGGLGQRKRDRDPLGVPPEKWSPFDVANYFVRRFKMKWGNDVILVGDSKIDGANLKGILAQLDADGFGRGLMARVIDHIFDQWDCGLPERLKWDPEHPTLTLITAKRWFEALAREVLNGIPAPRRGRGGAPRVRHDEYNPEAAKQAKASKDGWGN